MYIISINNKEALLQTRWKVTMDTQVRLASNLYIHKCRGREEREGESKLKN